MAEAAIVVSGGAAEKASASAPRPMSWPPSVADRYKNPVKLGQGFFGRVYAAWDTVNEQLVAVKQLSGRTDDEFVATGPCEFEQEVSSLLACHGHPNVVKFLAAFDDDADDGGGDRFIVTELAGPMNLRQLVQLRRKEKKPFTEGEVRHAMAQLLSGLACAHGAGIMHRDVTPENVVVDQQRRKKKKMAYKYTICGFNASETTTTKEEERDGSAMLTSSSPYRAPELFLGSMGYDDRIDTWALGCVMADLLSGTGSPFFGGGTEEEVFQKMLRVVGEQGIVDWPGFQKVAAPDVVAKLQREGSEHKACLREAFPKEMLSPAGFDVLSGLLQSNPEHRLTAAAALEMPWFRRRRRGFAACFAAS